MHAEGWYQDPFHRHEARWISDGIPTGLVRDGGNESQDPPPSSSFPGELQPLAERAPANADDLRRADMEDADSEIFDPNAAAGAVWESFGESGSD